MAEIVISNSTTPTTPLTGKTTIYIDSTSKTLHSVDDTGAVTDYSSEASELLSAGVYTLPTLTDNLDGTYYIPQGTYHLHNATDGSGPLDSYVVAGNTLTTTPDSMNYCVCNYNSGTPVMQNITDVDLINETTIVPVYTVYADGTTLHYFNWDNLGKALTNKIHQSIVKTQRYRRESGLALSEEATRVVSITSARIWVGANRIDLDAAKSTTHDTYLYYHSSGNWTKTLVTQYDNTQYDNGTDLATLTNNKYAVNFVYRSFCNHDEIYLVLGQGDYSLSEAEDADPPSTLPGVLSYTSALVGKIVVEKGASTATTVENYLSEVFSATGVSLHNELSGLQGGTTSEYYHLTNAQHLIATTAASSVSNGYLTSADFTTFDAKIDGSGTSGQVTYFTSSGVISSDSNLQWSDVDRSLSINGSVNASGSLIANDLNAIDRLVVGPNSKLGDGYSLGIFQDARDYYVFMNVANTTAGQYASADFVANNDLNEYIDVGLSSSTYNDPLYSFAPASTAYIYTSNNDLSIASASGKKISFYIGTTAADHKITINSNGTGIGTTSPKSKLHVDGGIQCANDAELASADKVGTMRYRTSGSNSYLDMCMQTGASSYAWVNIVTNSW